MTSRRLGRFIPAIGGLVLSVSLTGCDLAVGHFGAQATDEWKRTYTLQAGGRLEVVNVNGSIDAEASDGQGVEVRAERIAKASRRA